MVLLGREPYLALPLVEVDGSIPKPPSGECRGECHWGECWGRDWARLGGGKAADGGGGWH